MLLPSGATNHPLRYRWLCSLHLVSRRYTKRTILRHFQAQCSVEGSNTAETSIQAYLAWPYLYTHTPAFLPYGVWLEQETSLSREKGQSSQLHTVLQGLLHHHVCTLCASHVLLPIPWLCSLISLWSHKSKCLLKIYCFLHILQYTSSIVGLQGGTQLTV